MIDLVLTATTDCYGDVLVNSCQIKARGPKLHACLTESLKQWKQNNVGGVWCKIETQHAEILPVFFKNGFEIHHSRKDYIMVTKWIADCSSRLPHFPFTTIGVDGLVVNKNGKFLMVREKIGPFREWNLPGGKMNPGESLLETAKREIFEETSLVVEGSSVLCFAETKSLRWPETSDVMFTCLMTPVDSEQKIKSCHHEIDDFKWFTISEAKRLLDHDISHAMRYIISCYEKLILQTTVNYLNQYPKSEKDWKETDINLIQATENCAYRGNDWLMFSVVGNTIAQSVGSTYKEKLVHQKTG